MPLKRTVIEAAPNGGLLITREKLPNFSGTAKDRRAGRRANAPREFRAYAQVQTASLLELPPEAEKWLRNSNWPLDIQPLGQHNLRAAENDQIAERYKYEANLTIIANALTPFSVQPARKAKVTISYE